MRWVAVGLLLGVLPLAGCHYYRISDRGRSFNDHDLGWIIRGVTRKSEVRAKLGRPSSYQGRLLSMQETEYCYSRGKSVNDLRIGNEDDLGKREWTCLSLKFTPQDIVEDYEVRRFETAIEKREVESEVKL